MAYTYLIGWSNLNRYYYGVRYSKKCHPTDLFVTYFTSSKRVKQFIKIHGNPDIIQIRKVFTEKKDAILWENKVLRRMKVIERDVWLNQTDNMAICSERWTIKIKGKTYEEIYGIEKAKKLKEHRALTNKNRIGIKWKDENKKRLSDKYKNGGNPKATKINIKVDNISHIFDCRKTAASFLSTNLNIKYYTAYTVLVRLQTKNIPDFNKIYPEDKRKSIKDIYEKIELL